MAGNTDGQAASVHTASEPIGFAGIGTHVPCTACVFFLYTSDEIPPGLKIKSHFKKLLICLFFFPRSVICLFVLPPSYPSS